MSQYSDEQFQELSLRLKRLEEKVLALERAQPGTSDSGKQIEPGPKAPFAASTATVSSEGAASSISAGAQAAVSQSAVSQSERGPSKELLERLGRPQSSQAPQAAPQAAPFDKAVLQIKEFFLRGNPLNKIGAFTLLVSAGMFFKVAADNGWIGPSGRVVLGIIAGLALIAGGNHCQKKGWTNIASGFLGAGQGIVYLAVFNGQQRYHLFGGGVALALDVALTALVFLQALRFNSQAVAVMGLLGGFITPILASTGSSDFVGLSLYLLILNSAVLVISFQRTWRLLKWISFTFTELYLVAWASRLLDASYPPSHYSLSLGWFIPFSALFFLYFMAIPAYRSVRKKDPFLALDIYLTLANGAVTFGTLYILLSDRYRPYLGLAAAVTAAAYFYLCSLLSKLGEESGRAFKTMLAVGAWFLFAAAPMLVSGHYITMVWSLEGAAIAWYGTRRNVPLLFEHALGILVLVAVRLVIWDDILRPPRLYGYEQYIPFGDKATLAGLVAAACAYFTLKVIGPSLGGSIKTTGLWLGASAAIAAAAFRELFRFSSFVVGADLPVSPEFFAVTLWSCFAMALILATLKLVSGDRMTKRVFSVAACALMIFTVVYVSAFGQVFIGPAAASSAIRMGALAFVEQVIVLALLGIGVLSLFVMKNHGPDRADKADAPIVIFLGVSLFFLTLIVVRRELAALIFLPPLAGLIPEGSRRSVYEMAVSCSYSLLSFFLYLRGVATRKKPLIYAAYALFLLTGLKVYLHDLATASQIYRALSLFFFGAVLLTSEFFKQRLLENDPAKEGEQKLP